MCVCVYRYFCCCCCWLLWWLVFFRLIFRLSNAIFINFVCPFVCIMWPRQHIRLCSVHFMRCFSISLINRDRRSFMCDRACLCVQRRFKHFPHKFKPIMVLLLICPWVRWLRFYSLFFIYLFCSSKRCAYGSCVDERVLKWLLISLLIASHCFALLLLHITVSWYDLPYAYGHLFISIPFIHMDEIGYKTFWLWTFCV